MTVPWWELADWIRPFMWLFHGGKLKTDYSGPKRKTCQVLLKNEKNGTTVAELGIGTNEAAILNGIILEDEKVYGTVHIAFGTNTSLGERTRLTAIWMELFYSPPFTWMMFW